MANTTGPTVTVDGQALRQVLVALVGQPHHIRELQATRSLHKLGYPNPIDILIEQFNAAVEPQPPQPSPAAQGDAPDAVDVPDQCPYFGPSPHRDVWLDGWYAAIAARKQ